MIKRPETAEQYVNLVDQLIDELSDLRMSAEYDMDSLGGAFEFLDQLDAQVRQLRDSMADGSYHFRDENLPFMALVNAQSEADLPFKYLFHMVNETHRKGLDPEDVD